jgi:hypothetical protein
MTMRTITRVRATIKQVNTIDSLLTTKSMWVLINPANRKALRRVWARLQTHTTEFTISLATEGK